MFPFRRAGATVKMPWSGRSRAEVRAIAIDLINRHGADASEEAAHLAQVALQLGSQENARLYSRAAHHIQAFLHAASRERAAAERKKLRQ